MRFRFGGMFCPCTLLAGKLPDPVGVAAAIREQHRLGKQGAEENRTKPVLRLTWREREMDRQAIGVHDRMNLTGQAPSRATHVLMARAGPRRYHQAAIARRKAANVLNLLPLSAAERTWPDLLLGRPCSE